MPRSRYLIIALLTALVSGCATTQAPEISEDGLPRVSDDRFDTVYRMPDSDLGDYESLVMAPCTVSFRDHWLRDQNRSRPATGNRVDQDDVDRITAALSEDCDSWFKDALSKEPAYPLADENASTQGALVVAPAIINLDVNAPDVRGPGMVQNYTTSAGEMTLSLELRDGDTGTVLARIIDRQEDPDDLWMEWTTSVSNRADARRILRRWSERLRSYMDENT